MTALATAPAAAESDNARRPRSLQWRKAPSKLPRPYIARQGRITHLAFAQLGGLESAMAFLNGHHAGLGAKPLDLAGDSEAGYAAVSGEVLRLAAATRDERR